jgi:DNA repair photolyase
VRSIPAKTIISGYSGDNGWFGNHYNMNIYKGCSHGCIYCDSRSECYGVEDFDEVRFKENALTLIEKELKGKRKKGIVGTGSMSDPYNPLEAQLKLTRGALELIRRYSFGVSIATKSDLVCRDSDVLVDIAKEAPVLIKMTITTSDDALAKIIEPFVSPPSKRFEALKYLSDLGLYTGILMMPILPFIEDTEANVLGIVEGAKASGVKFIYPGLGVTLRQNQREWYFDKLEDHFPGIKKRYISTFGTVYSCGSTDADRLKGLIKERCKTYGILTSMKAIIADYQKGYVEKQISLFD